MRPCLARVCYHRSRVWQAKALLDAKLALVSAPGSVDELDAYVAAVAELKAALQVHAAQLAPEELGHFVAVTNTAHQWGVSFLDGLKVTELKALAKAKKLSNWAFANKEQLVTLLSASSDAAKQDVLQTLATKVAGYGKGVPKLKAGHGRAFRPAPR